MLIQLDVLTRLCVAWSVKDSISVAWLPICGTKHNSQISWCSSVLPGKCVLCYDRQSAGQSVLEQSTHLGLNDQIFITCVTVTVLFLWGDLSNERSGLSFVYAAGLCQHSLSRIRVPWDLRPYFTVSHLRLTSR
jgi:hypothetical protein